MLYTLMILCTKKKKKAWIRKQSVQFERKKKKTLCRHVTSHPPAACRASCPCEGGDGAADGWEDKRKAKKASGKIREWGTARVSTVRREIDTTIFLRG